MRNIATIIAITLLINFHTYAQEVTASLNDARSSYTAGNLDDARFALEETLRQIDQAIGKEILEKLPASISGMNYRQEDDNVVGTSLGFVGLFVNRDYYSDTQSASIEIIGDSPLMAGLNALLAMPAMMTGNDPNQKRIKVQGYKSLLQKSTGEDGSESYSIQIPGNSTLITVNCNNMNENAAVALANAIPVAEIFKLSQ
jgi:hypothetical protein